MKRFILFFIIGLGIGALIFVPQAQAHNYQCWKDCEPTEVPTPTDIPTPTNNPCVEGYNEVVTHLDFDNPCVTPTEDPEATPSATPGIPGEEMNGGNAGSDGRSDGKNDGFGCASHSCNTVVPAAPPRTGR